MERSAAGHGFDKRDPLFWAFLVCLGAAPLIVIPGYRFNLVNWSPPQQAWLVFVLGGLLAWQGWRLIVSRNLLPLDRPVSLLLAALVLGAVVSAARTPGALQALPQVANLLILVGVFLLTRALVETESAFRLFWIGPLLGLAGVILVGLIQLLGVALPISQGVAPAATLGNKNIAAEFVAAALPLTAFWAHGATGARGRAVWALVGAGVLFILGAKAVAALAALLTAALAVWAMGRGGRFFLSAMVIWAVLLVGGFSFLALSREQGPIPGGRGSDYSWLDQKKRNAAERLLLWREAVGLWRQNPLLGQGPGGFNNALAQSREPSEDPVSDALFTFRRQPYRAHNAFLTLSAETGLGGLALLALFLVSGARLWRNRSLAPAPWLMGSLSALLVAFSMSVSVAVPMHMALLGTVLGLVSALGGAGRRAGSGSGPGMFRLVLGVLGVVMAVWPLGRQLTADVHRSRAESCLEKGGSARAGRLIAEARELNLWDPNIPLLAGVMRQGQGDPAGAEGAYQEVLKLFPNHPNALHNLALIKFAGGDLDQGLKLAQGAARIVPTEAEPLRLILAINRQKGDLAAAGRALERLIALDRFDYRAHYDLGRLLLEQGRPERAAWALIKAGSLCRRCPLKNAIDMLLARALAGGGSSSRARPGG